jgi:hypothetical protein
LTSDWYGFPFLSGQKSSVILLLLGVFSADEFSEGDDGIGDEFRMLDELRGVAGNSRDQDLPRGSFTSRQTLYSCS